MGTTAFAADNQYQGVLCNPAKPGDASRLNYNKFGVHNTSTTTTASVFCGAAPVVSSNINLIEAVVYDRHPIQDVCCFLSVQNSAGVVITEASRCSVGSGVGSQLLSFIPPINTVGTAIVSCTIPPRVGNNASHVTSYRIRSNP
jgi:hypothetical protein